MKKIITCLVALSMCLLACGCNTNNANSENSPSSSQTDNTQIAKIDAKEIIESMFSKTNDFPDYATLFSHDENGNEIDGWKDGFGALYSDFSSEKVSEFAIYYSTETTADELTVVVLKDKNDVEELKNVMKNYISTRISQFENYGPEEVPKLQSAKIISKDNYVALIVCDNPEEISAGFKEVFA